MSSNNLHLTLRRLGGRIRKPLYSILVMGPTFNRLDIIGKYNPFYNENGLKMMYINGSKLRKWMSRGLIIRGDIQKHLMHLVEKDFEHAEQAQTPNSHIHPVWLNTQEALSKIEQAKEEGNKEDFLETVLKTKYKRMRRIVMRGDARGPDFSSDLPQKFNEHIQREDDLSKRYFNRYKNRQIEDFIVVPSAEQIAAAGINSQ
eukprot:TRINITY_DN6815_c0_g1_i1.p1 TRINITY_DN6815_c0_g1~~TRINITY_DN6815_c0_g1_i1.p1  ORF type:complete len:202 (-),score=102.92 TRINITY_DN6815_c0_g1_i1:114-719(-)